MTRRHAVPLLVASALLAALPALAAPTPREVKEALESRDAARIRALFAGLRDQLDAPR